MVFRFLKRQIDADVNKKKSKGLSLQPSPRKQLKSENTQEENCNAQKKGVGRQHRNALATLNTIVTPKTPANFSKKGENIANTSLKPVDHGRKKIPENQRNVSDKFIATSGSQTSRKSQNKDSVANYHGVAKKQISDDSSSEDLSDNEKSDANNSDSAASSDEVKRFKSDSCDDQGSDNNSIGEDDDNSDCELKRQLAADSDSGNNILASDSDDEDRHSTASTISEDDDNSDCDLKRQLAADSDSDNDILPSESEDEDRHSTAGHPAKIPNSYENDLTVGHDFHPSGTTSDTSGAQGVKRRTKRPRCVNNKVICLDLTVDELMEQQWQQANMAKPGQNSWSKLWCPYCPYDAYHESAIKEHVEEMHNTKFYSFPCHICDEGYNRKSKLKNHMAKHAKPGFSCLYCKQQFRCKNTFHTHVTRSHMLKEEKNLKYKCQQCTKSYKAKPILTQHVKVKHSTDGQNNKYWCLICNGSFVQKPSLVRHIERFHSKNPRFKCEACKDNFGTASDLKRHMISHFDAEMKCEFCGVKCKHTESMENHLMLQHTRQLCPNLKCQVCDKTFDKVSDLENHKEKFHKAETLMHVSYDSDGSSEQENSSSEQENSSSEQENSSSEQENSSSEQENSS